jgi:hypothetical protein
VSLIHFDPLLRRFSSKPPAFAVEFYIVSNSISGTIPSMIGALKSLGMCSFGVAPPCYSVGTLRRF